MTASANDDPSSAEDEVVQLCSELIRIDTTNTADPETLVGEAEAADYVADKLREVGAKPIRREGERDGPRGRPAARGAVTHALYPL